MEVKRRSWNYFGTLTVRRVVTIGKEYWSLVAMMDFFPGLFFLYSTT
jgi:hypothetical protein